MTKDVPRKTITAVKLDNNPNPYPAFRGVGCDFDKETVKVSGVEWTSF